MPVSWSDIELFLAISDAGSLSAAARILRVTQPTVSRRLAELEAELGEPLFARSADGASLTSFGERMLGPARRMAESAADVERIVEGADASPRGVVRITAPPGVAFDFLAPFASSLRTRLPDVQLEVVSAVHYLDLVKREADLGLRMAALDRASRRDLVILATQEPSVAAYATREYAATLPRGYRMTDVRWVGWPPSHDHVQPNPYLAGAIPGFRPIFTSDDYLVQIRAAEAGVGAVLLGRVRSRRALPTPLVELNLDLPATTAVVHLVCARASLAIPRVKAVAELLAAEMKRGSKRAQPR